MVKSHIINELCNTHYQKLPNKGKPCKRQWTNMASIILENVTMGTKSPECATQKNVNENDIPQLQVIAMATGTKCLGEKNKSSWVVGDGHAEVLCLRLFRLFLVREMLHFLRTRQSELLLLDSDQCAMEPPRFRLKEGILFHFYTSCVMCGDATISDVQVDCKAGNIDITGNFDTNGDNKPSVKHLKSNQSKRSPSYDTNVTKYQKTDALIRTGAKSLLSDDLSAQSLKTRTWSEVGVLRTKPGRGHPTLSLSCSDKLMKRQWLGLQGGMLFTLIREPIRFSSFVVAGEMDCNSVYRALFGRVNHSAVKSINYTEVPICNVPNDFVDSEKGQAVPSSGNCAAASFTSLLWIKTHGSCEQYSCVHGKIQGAAKKSAPEKVMLPICRRYMFNLSNQIIKTLLGHDTNLIIRLSEVEFSRKYTETKSDYRKYKEELFSSFKGWSEKKRKFEEMSNTQKSPQTQQCNQL